MRSPPDAPSTTFDNNSCSTLCEPYGVVEAVAKLHQVDVVSSAYSGETGHPIRGKWPPGRSEATLGIS